MDKSKKTKTTQVDLQRNSVSDHTEAFFTWQTNKTNNHIYFNDEWNGEENKTKGTRVNIAGME